MATIQYVVNAVDAASATFERIAGSADHLNNQLDELGRKTAEARVGMKGDKEASLTIDKLELKMANLAKKTAEGKIGVEGQARALVQIRALELKLDELSHKHVTATVDVKVNRSVLSRLGGVLGTGEGGGPLAGGLGSPVGIGALAGGGALAAGLVPGIVGLLTGGGVGALGAAGGVALGQKANQQIQKLALQLQHATGQNRKFLLEQIAEIRKANAPALQIFGAISDLGKTLTGVFAGALGAGGKYSFAAGIADIAKQLAAFAKSIGPQLGDLSRASLPFLRSFVTVLEEGAKAALPAFTQLMIQMVRSGALKQMTHGLVVLTQGLATFIENLGPGVKASAQIFDRLMTATGRVLGFLGDLFTVTAKIINGNWADMWRAIVASAKADIAIIVNSARAFWHAMAASFDALRHDIASIWDTIWRNTVTRARNGITDVINWVKTLPGRAISALQGLGTSLYNFFHQAFTKMWNGAKAVATSIWNWLTSWVKALPGWLRHLLGIKSPSSVFYDIGKQMMMGLFHGIKDHAQHARSAAQGAVGSGGAGVGRWAPLVRQALKMEGLAPYLAGRVLYQMQTESGGNPRAINLTDINAQSGDPSRGLMQVIGSTFRAYHWPGTSWNIYNPLANVAAALNYARHVYGPSLMRNGLGIGSGHGYDSGGWLPTGASVAVNMTGQPERVVSPSGEWAMLARLDRIAYLLERNPGATAAGFAGALNGAARAAAR